jgi:transcriptional regulator with GAF, ATPase, and Fis domain
VRDLQNSIERALILAHGSFITFDWLETADTSVVSITRAKVAKILTSDELKERERENLVTALARTHGKIFGTNGAAALLGMKPTTLISRINSLGLKRG